MSDLLVNTEINQGHRAADELFLEFERMIISGELANGEALPPEREIVDTFGVSRTVVREAILALSNKGLVEAKPIRALWLRFIWPAKQRLMPIGMI